MPKQRFGLGRGLDALIPGAVPVADDVPMDTALPNASLFEVPVAAISPNPQQPRLPTVDDQQLLELATSIQEYGLLQPVLVALDGADEDGPHYQLIAGERRWRAAQIAGLDRVPAVIRDATPQLMLEMALVENLQRTDLNPLEEAQGYQMLMEDYGLTQEQAADRVGRNRATVANTLRLLQLPPEVRELLVGLPKVFTEGHARAVLQVTGEAERVALARQIIAQLMSVRQAEEMARRYNEASLRLTPDRRGGRGERPQSYETHEIEEKFTQAVEMKVRLQRTTRGKGSVTFFFSTDEQLQTLYDRIVGGGQLLLEPPNGNGHGAGYSVAGDGMDGLLDDTFDMPFIDADEPDSEN
ncbi:MAG TPA: ParB/RepB/Spo0J family partition protein [Ktedonobacterales bacterium]